jgi:hypothetical protein
VDVESGDLQGFQSIEDAQFWQERGCGIACLRMVLDGFRKQHGHQASGTKYGDLVYRGLEAGAYCERGWIHAGLVKLASEYGIVGKTFRRPLFGCPDAAALLNEIRMNRPCIASVTVGFEGGQLNRDGTVISPGGHLVVVLGFEGNDPKPERILVHHPSSWKEYNWESRWIDFQRFEASSTGSFMSFWEHEG